jgi:hypothetical protein
MPSNNKLGSLLQKRSCLAGWKHLKDATMDEVGAGDTDVGGAGGVDRDLIVSSEVGGYLPRVRLTLDTGMGWLDSVGASATNGPCGIKLCAGHASEIQTPVQFLDSR